MRSLPYILIIFLLSLSVISPAQDTSGVVEGASAPVDVKPDKPYFKSYLSDSWRVLTSPVEWRGRQWVTAAAVSGITILLYTQDDVIRDFAQRNQTHGLDQANEYFFKPLGSAIVTIPLAVGFYAYGALARKDRASRTGLAGVKALAITAVFTYAIKYGTQRHSPYDDTPPDPRVWEGPFGNYESTSFPSGHSSMAWALATVIASEYRDRIWVPLISYSMATLVSASRVYGDEHWMSDVFFGAALGFFIGKFVYKSTVWCPNLVIIPGASLSGHPGFTLAYHLR